jgi:hypothetical protein
MLLVDFLGPALLQLLQLLEASEISPQLPLPLLMQEPLAISRPHLLHLFLLSTKVASAISLQQHPLRRPPQLLMQAVSVGSQLHRRLQRVWQHQ